MRRDWLRIELGYDLRPRVTFADAPIAQLDGALCGLRVAFVADTHVCARTPEDALTRLVDLIAAQRPDLVLWGGDFAESPDDAARLCRRIGTLRPPLGMLAVPGNNDWEQFGAGYEGLKKLLDEAGARLLVNQSHKIPVGSDLLNIVGVDDGKYGAPDAAPLRTPPEKGEVRVLLAHNPCGLDALLKGVSPLPHLALCGHTHAGQLAPLGISPYTIAYERRRRGSHFFRVHGIHCIEGMLLVVTGGVGASVLPLRVGAPSEIHLLTLRKKI